MAIIRMKKHVFCYVIPIFLYYLHIVENNMPNIAYLYLFVELLVAYLRGLVFRPGGAMLVTGTASGFCNQPPVI